MPKIFRDTLLRKFESVQHDKMPKGVLAVLKGPCMEIEKINENMRWYPRSLIMNKIINDPDTQYLMKLKALIGEGCHPDERFHSEYPNTAILVINLWIPEEDPDRLWIEFWVLDTPVGRIIKTLIDVGSSIGISARAAGDAEERDGVEYMDEDTYTFFTFDCVPDPGFKTARPVPVNEQKILGKNIKEYTRAELEQTRTLLENLNPEYFAEQITQVNSILEQKEKGDTSKTFEELCEAKRKIQALEKSLESTKTERSHYSEPPRSVIELTAKAVNETKTLRKQAETSRRTNSQLTARLEAATKRVKTLERENADLTRQLEAERRKVTRAQAEAREGARRLDEERKRKPAQPDKLVVESLQRRIKKGQETNQSLQRELYESRVQYLATKTNLTTTQVKELVPTIEGNPDRYIKQLRKVERHQAEPIRGSVTEHTEIDEGLVSLISSQAKGVQNNG